MLRQKHLVSYIFGSVEFGGADEADAALVSVPPYHIAGMAAILSSVYSGRRVVQLSSFDAETWVRTAAAERVTHAFVVPTMLTRIVDVLVRGLAASPVGAGLTQPLEAAGYQNLMDVVARIHGGGVAAQASALRHGVARALVEADPALRGELKRRGYLTRDPREKERKKAGLKKARKRPQFSKR